MAILHIFVFTIILGLVHSFGAPSPNCGTKVGCLSFPVGCTNSNTCTLTLMYWKIKNENKVMFEARAVGDWVGVGLSDDHLMVGTTGEICKCEGSSCTIHGFDAFAQRRPPITAHPMGVEVTSISHSNGQILCNFKRSIQPLSSYMKDLRSGLHYMMAAGPVTGGLIQDHLGTRFVTASKLLAEEFTEDDSSIDTNTVLAITLPLAILIVLLILGFVVYYYSRKRSKRNHSRHVDGYTAGWKYPNRLEPYGYSYRQNPEIYNYRENNPRTLDNYSDSMYRSKYQPGYVNEGHQGDGHQVDGYMETPKKKRIDPDAQPFNKFFKEAKHKSGPEHNVYF